jgi:hypothetical protein
MLAGVLLSLLSLQSLDSWGQPPATGPVVLVDSTGGAAGRPLNETTVLVADRASGVVAPAAIRSVYDAEGRTVSGAATWQAGGSVLFASSDCTTGAHVFSHASAGLRATAQVETPNGVILYVGDDGRPTSVNARSILYGSGCTPVTVQQNGVVPVVTTINLTTTYPPPLSFR